ncbi:MAG: hypothetical protein SCK70_08925, partial [bacterium]|nr:hypothetical protein [bacterium]
MSLLRSYQAFWEPICSHSPLSDASNSVQLKTDIASKRLPGNDSYPDLGNNDQSKGFVLLVSPNPFNPETKISYRLS